MRGKCNGRTDGGTDRRTDDPKTKFPSDNSLLLSDMSYTVSAKTRHTSHTKFIYSLIIVRIRNILNRLERITAVLMAQNCRPTGKTIVADVCMD